MRSVPSNPRQPEHALQLRPSTRREFLRSSVQAGAALLAGGVGLLPGCGRLTTGGLDVAALTSAPPATVGLARGRDFKTLTHQVLERVGGIGSFVRPGEAVFIKPNFLTAGLGRTHPAGTGEIAKPELVVALAEECLEAGARHVTIGDGAQVEAFDFAELTTLDGRTHLAAEAARLNRIYDERVQLACLNRDSPAWDALPARRTTLGEIRVSSLVTRADRVISVPVLKTHRWAQVSLSMKNFMGVTPIGQYGGGSEDVGRHVLHNVPGGLVGCFLDLVEGLRPDLVVIDCSVGCEGYGPWVRSGEGRTVDLRERLGDWLLIASTDPVAADATAARLINHDPHRIIHLARAGEQGLGQLHGDQITLVGPTLDELRMEWEPI